MTAPSNRRIAMFVPLMVLAVIASLFAARLSEPRLSGSIDSPLIGHALPPLSLWMLDGKTVLNLHTVKPPYIINVFASWCAPCAIEHPQLMALKNAGVRIVGIAYKDTPENIRKFIDKRGDPYTKIVMDPDGMAGITLGITGVPESFSLDSDGIIRARQQGPLADDAAVKAFLP